VALASENISLAAWEEGIGSCLVGAFNKGKIVELLGVPEESHELALLIALGYPAHNSVIEEAEGDAIQYRRDEDGTFHVPKRPLKKMIRYNKF
jgi:nitroreductase